MVNLLYLLRSQKKKEPSPLAVDRFSVGDMVILNKENPYKGTLLGRSPYQIQSLHGYHLDITGENGTIGYFHHFPFELYTGLGRRMLDRSDEYEDVIRAQELYNGL